MRFRKIGIICHGSGHGNEDISYLNKYNHIYLYRIHFMYHDSTF